MIKIIKIIGVSGFFLCLMLMYGSNHGIKRIRKYDSSFRLLDMRFHYNSREVLQVFDTIGNEGRIAYQNFLILDFVFIVCLLISMLTVTYVIFEQPVIQKIFMMVCILRAIFDILENILLYRLLSHYPEFHPNMAWLCSWFTTIKFIMLYTWVLGILVKAGIRWLK